MKRTIIVLALLVAACDEASRSASRDRRRAARDRRGRRARRRPSPARRSPITRCVASPEGPLVATPHWAFCLAPKPPTEDNAVSDGCLGDDQLVDLGVADQVTGTMPSRRLPLFGPDSPPGGFRPRDADATGGYYQPVPRRGRSRPRVRPDADHLQAADGATHDVAHDYDTMYVANANPVLAPPVLDTVAADADIALTASWPADAAETLPRLRSGFADAGHPARGDARVVVRDGRDARRRRERRRRGRHRDLGLDDVAHAERRHGLRLDRAARQPRRHRDPDAGDHGAVSAPSL